MLQGKVKIFGANCFTTRGGGGLIHKSSKGRNLHKPSDMSKEGNKTLMRKIETIVSQHIQETKKTFRKHKIKSV